MGFASTPDWFLAGAPFRSAPRHSPRARAPSIYEYVLHVPPCFLTPEFTSVAVAGRIERPSLRSDTMSSALRFEDDFLRKLEYLTSSRSVHSQAAPADRLTPTRGRGLEFADHRPYTDDDFRHRLEGLQRLSRLLLRLFDEERTFRLPDDRRQPLIAEPAKFRHGAPARGGACYIGLAHLDRATICHCAPWAGASPGAAGRTKVFSLEQMQAPGRRPAAIDQGVRLTAPPQGADGNPLRLPGSPGS